MQFDPDGFEWQKWAFHPLVASLLGAAMTFWNSVPGETKSVKTTNALTSLISGVFLGSTVVEWREMTSRPLIGLTHLLFAVGGLILMSGFLAYLRDTKFADLPFVGKFLKKEAV